MLWIYRLLFLPALLLAAPYYISRMMRRGGYRRHFSHRLGAIAPLPEKRVGVRRIWLQSVSVGEMFAIGPILEAFKTDPSVEIYLTTTTSTGYKVASDRYRDTTIGIGYFPIDWWPFSWRAWHALRPDLAILTEGERWPEHIRQARARGVPVLCVNARMSDRSFRRMRACRGVIAPLLQSLSRVLACSEHDAARFRELGVAPDRLTVTGNIKLDLTIPPLSAEQRVALRAELGLGDEPVLLGSSTWPGEEAALIRAFKAVRAAGLPCRLLLVPRHAERRNEVEALLSTSGLAYHFRSRGVAPNLVDVAVGDTTGELRKFTQLAELVFVGKSLPPHEQGQTPVEAAALGRPLLFGPGMTNFHAIASELLECGAARVVENPADLAQTAVALMRDANARSTMAAAAQAWHRANRGAVARTLEVIRAELSHAGELQRPAGHP